MECSQGGRTSYVGRQTLAGFRGGCGEHFEISVRREYQHRHNGTTPRCLPCRRPPKPMTEAERARYRRWWLEESGLSRDEVRAIAVGLDAVA
jgi:hypothetical protein